MIDSKYMLTLTLSIETLALIEFDLAINASKHERIADACGEAEQFEDTIAYVTALHEAAMYNTALEELTKAKNAAIDTSRYVKTYATNQCARTYAKAKAWFDTLEEKFSSMSDEEQNAWLTTTDDGKSYTEIMNASWREDWEEIIDQMYRERFGA